MTAREELYSKLSAEYAAFIERLESLTPREIIDAAYESVFKADILICFEYGDSFSERQIAALLALEAPLDELYRNWLDTDASYMDDLSDSISDFAVCEIERRKGIDGAGTSVQDGPEISAELEAPESREPPETMLKPPEPKKKRSITARLREAGAEAKAYNAQRAQQPKNQSKSKNTREERS
jgi:hypothetical protein